jgi:oligoendopeptidase F
VRKFRSSLHAALFPHNIPEEVYTSLIQTVKKHLGLLHRYVSLRKKLLKLPEIHLYDMYVPLLKDIEFSISYEEAEKLTCEATSALGPEYRSLLEKGLLRDRWVDRYENKNKRSGAYSSGCYDSFPYILMNYRGSLRDLFTLSHEAGHSMHSLLSHTHQKYQDAAYPIFVAEVASTFNEELLMHHLLERAKSREERLFLLNEKIEDIRATFFRQTMFAEFELLLHQLVESGTPLTPSLIKEKYYALNREYFGPEMVLDDIMSIEWARIPHFYYNFYVYQYATGISAALALAERVLKKEKDSATHYLNFLKSGGSLFPIDLLKIAGVDMAKPTAVEATLKKFESLITEFEKLNT